MLFINDRALPLGGEGLAKKKRDKRRDKKRETKEGKSVKLAGRVLQMKIKGKAARKGAIDWRLL
jgi:hypothetical protein